MGLGFGLGFGLGLGLGLGLRLTRLPPERRLALRRAKQLLRLCKGRDTPLQLRRRAAAMAAVAATAATAVAAAMPAA